MAHIAMVVTNACAPDPRVERHAIWLTELGHDVEIHAWDRQCTNPRLEQKNGYKIVRYQFGDVGSSMPFRTWFMKKKFISNLKLEHDLLILNDTDTANVSFQGPVILDIHDLAHTWPLMRGNSPLHKFASRRMLSQAKRIIRDADEIVVSAPDFCKWVAKYGRDSTCVMNRRNSSTIPITKEKIVGYFGRIRELKPIISLLDAAKKAGFKVILAGDGSEVENVLRKNPDVDYRGPFTEEDLPDLMKEISVMYAMYNEKRANIKHGAIPTKMLDAAAFGIPSIVNQNTPMGELCESEELGKTAPYGDIEKISEAMLQAHGMKISKIKGEDKLEFIRVVRKLLD
tara:strand:- start:232 stop:1257 length:1026 start_codon:yes stop_codon:yes gene_type:complete